MLSLTNERIIAFSKCSFLLRGISFSPFEVPCSTAQWMQMKHVMSCNWINPFSLILIILLTVFLVCLWRNTFFLIIHIVITSLSRTVFFTNSQIQLQNCHVFVGWKRLRRCSWSSWAARSTNQRWQGKAQGIFLVVSTVNYS